jgi:hypothetical protein
MKKFPKILFFVDGTVPTAKDMLESEKYGPNVSFRNARMISAEGAFEMCDGVAGCVPVCYLKAKDTKTGEPLFLSAEEALNNYRKGIEEAYAIADAASKKEAASNKAASNKAASTWKANA